MPISLVKAAMARTLIPQKDDPNDLGVDVARKGNNESVIIHRHGPVARLLGVYHRNDLMELTGWVAKYIKETGCTRCKIDDPGMGGGVTDRLKELRSNGELPPWCNIVPVNVGLGPTEKDPLKKRFFNLKDEMEKELQAINSDLDSTSPDRWDALVLAFAEDAPVDKLSSWRKFANSMDRRI